MLTLFNFAWPLLYFLPTFLAWRNRDRPGNRLKTIFWVNPLLGWTIVMWIVAAIWMAFMGSEAYR